MNNTAPPVSAALQFALANLERSARRLERVLDWAIARGVRQGLIARVN
jgi:hypothetical protein